VSKISKILLTFIFAIGLPLTGAPAVQAGTVVQVTTPLGNFSVELFDDVTPVTVANFLHYVNTGLYNGTFVHRSVSNFVIQGGWLRYDESLNRLFEIPVNPPVQNEFQVSNTRGTLAMAKVGGDPNSATSQWFINLADNSFLDSSNGGFTVFGQVLGNGMEVVDAIARLPVAVLIREVIDTAPVINLSGPSLKNQHLVEITMAVSEPSAPGAWPAAFNGIAPDPDLELALNNIGYLDFEGQRIYSCLAIQTNNLPSTLDGISRFDIVFDIVSLDQDVIEIIQINRFRPFNLNNELTSGGEEPSCSGIFETTTGLYTDVIQTGSETFLLSFLLLDGEALTLSLQQVQVLLPFGGWPSAYNGVMPNPDLNLAFNNIGKFNPDDGMIYSCLAIQTNQLPDTLDGIARFDIVFEIVSLEAGIIRVSKTRPFNAGNVLNDNGEAPSCSGVFETTTNLYEDVIQVEAETLRVVFELFDGDALELVLKDVEGL